uniref:Uncharacterized protein n=1 Tax=Oryza glumipatula TaxID=40148 RepID=A0A0E0BKI5_9ORYZ
MECEASYGLGKYLFVLTLCGTFTEMECEASYGLGKYILVLTSCGKSTGKAKCAIATVEFLFMVYKLKDLTLKQKALAKGVYLHVPREIGVLG